MNQRLIAAMLAAIDILRGGLRERLHSSSGLDSQVPIPKEIDPSLLNDITFVEGDYFDCSEAWPSTLDASPKADERP